MSEVLWHLEKALKAAQRNGYTDVALESLIQAGDFIHGLEQNGVVTMEEVPASAMPCPPPAPLSATIHAPGTLPNVPAAAAAPGGVIADVIVDDDDSDDDDTDDDDGDEDDEILVPVSQLAGTGPIVLA